MLVMRAPSLLVFGSRLPARPGGRTRAPALALGCGLSLMVHVLLLAVFAAAPASTLANAAPDQDSSAIEVTLSPAAGPEAEAVGLAVAAAPAEPPPSVAPRKRPSQWRPRPARPIVASPVAADVSAEGDVSADVAPVVDETSTAPAVVDSTSAVAPGAGAGGGGGAGVVPAPAVVPVVARPVLVSPSVGRGLRMEDEYPQLPEALKVAGFTQSVMVQICVSTRGAVDQVQFDTDVPRALLKVLEPAIRRWQYRALVMGGAAVPFCHQMRIEYRMT